MASGKEYTTDRIRNVAVLGHGADRLARFGAFDKHCHCGDQKRGGKDHVKPQLRNGDTADVEDAGEVGREDDLLMPKEFEIDPLNHHGQAKRHDKGVDVIGISYRAIGQKFDQYAKGKPDQKRNQDRQ